MLVAGAVFGSSVDAAPTFTVDSPFDVVAGGDLTNGVCETAPGNGVCTLRAAVMKANHFPGGGVTINIPAGTYTLTIAPANPPAETAGALQIAQTTTIVGAGMDITFVDGGGLDRVFYVLSGTVSISSMTVRNANNSTGDIGGGILSTGNLTLDTIHLTQNRARNGAGFGNVPPGVAVINNSLIDSNATVSSGGGIFNLSAQLTVNNSAIVNNTASQIGGGLCHVVAVAVPAGVMTLNDTTVSGNHAMEGGGIFVGYDPSGASSLILDRSTINANSAAEAGGGIFVEGAQLTANNSTISANSAQGNGGGIFNEGASSLFHVSIAGNVAESAENGTSSGGAIYNLGTMSLWNSLLAENHAGVTSQECDGTVALNSQDYNYSQATCNFAGTTTHNLTGGDPSLGPLDNNGGATQTRALLAGSIVADQIPPALCRDSLGVAPTTDQRGVQRPINGLCDMGAFEGSVPVSLFNANLIRNGDAEDGGGSPTGAFIGAPHWTVLAGQFTVVQYGAAGGFPTVGTDVIPATHGYNFFAGGAAPFSRAFQLITLTAAGAVIDTGTVRYDLSGDFGGYATDNDDAQLSITFLDANQAPIGDPIGIGNFNAAYRNNKTGLFNASTSGMVPPSTRYIEVDVYITRMNGAYNDGYADNLSLILSGGPATPDLDQHGLTGSWYKPATSGQGIELEIFPDLSSPGMGLSQLSWFTYDTVVGASDRQRWYTISGPVVSGQPRAALVIYENTGGNFNAPPVTTAQAVGAAILSFDSCTNGLLSYSFSDGSGRSGIVPLQRLTQNVTCSTTSARPTNTDFALSGNWYDPATSGQGFTVEVNPTSGVLFLAWYTYAPGGAGGGAAGQRWFTALGHFAPGARSIPLQLAETTRGSFDAVVTPPLTTVVVGSATLAFQSCSSATLNFNFTGGSSSGKSGTIALSRVGPVPPGCTQ